MQILPKRLKVATSKENAHRVQKAKDTVYILTYIGISELGNMLIS